MHKIIILALFYCLIPTALLLGQADVSRFHKVEENFIHQLKAWPQEKIHLHTDRDYYVPGEKIWFKAYVNDAVTHQYPTFSRYLYVELIDAQNTLVNRVMIRLENMLFYGHLFLSEVIPEGNYTLRAYTRYMENLGDDYFFKKNIRIGNLAKSRENGESRGNRESRKNQINHINQTNHSQDFDVSFFPEGGNVIEGYMNKIAFKALNMNGNSATISGEMIHENGEVIASVETLHAGMGVFFHAPETGKRYFLICRNETGMEKQFELPKPDPRACALTATRHNKNILVSLHTSAHSSDSPCYLLAHCRGMLLYFDVWNRQIEYVSFSEEDLPAGIIQLILFDEDMNPLSERLIFNKKQEDTKLEFRTAKTVFEKRDKVIVSLKVPTLPNPEARENDAGFAHFSVAVTDDRDIAVDESTTIFSSLLLSSELKGYIENPAWYLQDNRVATTALDYLMMTHGWRRYNIPEVAKGNWKEPHIPFQTNQALSGRAKSGVLSRPAANSEISVMTNDGDFGFTETDENGAFLFDDFDYPDSTSFFLRTLGKRGSSRVELIVDEELFPEPVHARQGQKTEIRATDNEIISELATDAFIAKAEQRSQYDEDMWMLHLSEVKITAPRIERKDEPRLQFWANAKSDVTIRREEIEKHSFHHVAEYIALIPGVQVSINSRGSSRILIRGGSGLNSGPPLVFVDGTPIHNEDKMALSQIPIDIVESIDVFKGVNTAIFGARGGPGVISITTRKGRVNENSNVERDEHNYTVYTPLGYQKPVAFYSPKYDTLEAKRSVIPDYRTTIFWKPDVVIGEDGEASFEFYTSDFATTYSVVIEGLTADGRIVRQVEKIRVE